MARPLRTSFGKALHPPSEGHFAGLRLPMGRFPIRCPCLLLWGARPPRMPPVALSLGAVPSARNDGRRQLKTGGLTRPQTPGHCEGHRGFGMGFSRHRPPSFLGFGTCRGLPAIGEAEAGGPTPLATPAAHRLSREKGEETRRAAPAATLPCVFRGQRRWPGRGSSITWPRGAWGWLCPARRAGERSLEGRGRSRASRGGRPASSGRG